MSSSTENPYSFTMPDTKTSITADFKQTTTTTLSATITASPNPAYVGEEVLLTCNATGGSGQYSYVWGSGIQAQSESLIYSSPGTYHPECTVTDLVTGQSITVTGSVTVQNVPSSCSFPVTTSSPASCILAAFQASGYYDLLSPSDQQAAAADPAGWLASHPYLYSRYPNYFAE